MENRVGSHRVTLRLPNSVSSILKKEADKRDLPLNALITKILFKNVSFDMQINALPAVTMFDFLFSRMISKISDADLEEIAREGPDAVKKLFAIQGIEYKLDEITENHFVVMSKYCGWFSFTNTVKNDQYRLIFETQLGSKWMQFIVLYVTNILESLHIRIDSKTMHENVVIFSFSKKITI
ncbi:MAG: hypothetical protein WBV92_04890 [Nitrosotalea sp.]